MIVYPNYIADTNRFRLAGPPQWFQKQLWEFDSSLAIVPSRQGFFYRLGQRRKLKLAENIVNDVLKEQADTAMLASYGLIPVTTILATVRWDSPIFFEKLKEMAPWRNGGTDAVERRLLSQERQMELDTAAKQDDMLNYLSKDAWRFYQQKRGLRTHLWSPTVKSDGPTGPETHSIIIPKSDYKPQLQTAWGNVLAPKRGPRANLLKG